MLCVLLLLGAVEAQHSLIQELDWIAPERYHRQLAEAAHDIPKRIGPWTGESTKVPAPAIEMLDPNVLISRLFRNTATGESVSVLLVQSRNTRSISGHYPDNCYPSSGWTIADKTKTEWQVGDRRLPGTRYHFRRTRGVKARYLTVASFLCVPGIGYRPDMSGFWDLVVNDYRRRPYGGASFQVVMPGRVSDTRLDRIFRELTKAHLPFLEEIRTGTRADQSG